MSHRQLNAVGSATGFAVAAVLLTACSDGVLLATAPVNDHAARISTEAISVAGDWNWSSTEQLTVPDWVAAMFGMPSEGPVTRLVCESSGTLELIQNGSTFSGSGEQTSITCETGGGEVFVPPAEFSPPFFSVVEGTIRGRSIQFVTGGPLPSTKRGVISAFDGGVAEALSATGRTIVPGHPQSPIPAEPPPGGTSKTLSWEAVR